jgi:hypothetical protein
MLHARTIENGMDDLFSAIFLSPDVVHVQQFAGRIGDLVFLRLV